VLETRSCIAASLLLLIASLACGRCDAQDAAAYSVDIAVTRAPAAQASVDVLASEITASDSPSGTVTVRRLPGVPASADLVALETDPVLLREWLAFDTTLSLPASSGSVIARPRDLVRHDRPTGTYAIAVPAEALGAPDGIGIDAIARSANGDFLLSFDGWFETAGRVLRPDALYRFDSLAGVYAAVPAFDPAIGGPEAPANLDLADAPRGGPYAGSLLLGFDDAIGYAGNTVRYDGTAIVVADASTSLVVAAYAFDAQIATPSAHDIDAFATTTAVAQSELLADGFEDP
jgi:hypothetical protein